MKLRKRILSPEFFQSADLAKSHPYGRLLFQGLWLLSDREGRLEDKPIVIKSMIFPYEPNIKIDNLLDDLSKNGHIVRYVAENRGYIWIINFDKYQSVHRQEAKSQIPPPPQNITFAASDEPDPVKGKSIVKTDPIPYDDIIADLNNKTGKNYKPGTESIRELIRARWQEGYRFDDFAHVHSVKAAEWAGTDNDKYLRPATLYRGSKFPGYREQKIINPALKNMSSKAQGNIQSIAEAINKP